MTHLLTETASAPHLARGAAVVQSTVAQLAAHAQQLATASRDQTEVGAREFAFGIARAYCGALLLAHAAASPAVRFFWDYFWNFFCLFVSRDDC